ncbi:MULTISPECIES: ectoine/hydroxyectoine ABC transporter substrate-binding protein EhuB [Achromobacter]|uniref:Amino acid ABC transporter substrate-binding protein n=1 Tax=Achromobacter spanius TaxID=217203 RepID=A0AAW3IBC8_9BURK|nr:MULTISPECIES: ectoine/hydroxyectoine ABC transporter substrate-binding protein EhuB [Achromobacter]KNE29271.1 amino acid ABC transporter substrate-binding protein [Achromobacter spanius]MCD0499512.1 ectoine/hydroxyectoine ABC transporter substrate-binding protein EhuB [Achromobacter sp. MY14]MCW3155062.1 ectoine/hydroxyectoine ABC transporter substrate-binding protein EhuB [Achromobacter spanius]
MTLLQSKRVLLALGLGVLAACSDSGGDKPQAAGEGASTSATSTLEAAKAAGKIRIGYANEAPFAYMDSKEAKVTGESVEIARVVLKRMGINEVEGVLTEFGSLIPGLAAKRFDIIAAGMYVTPERCKQVAFSDPTYGVGQAFLVKQGNPKNLHSYEDVAKNPDAKLGVVVGAIEGEYAEKVKIPSDQVVVFPDAVSALSGVQAGRADAYAATGLTVNDLMGKTQAGSDLEKADPFTDPVIDGKDVRGYGAYAFRTEDKDFADAFNAELTKFVGTDEHKKLVAPFGFTDDELPQGMTAAKLCAAQ